MKKSEYETLINRKIFKIYVRLKKQGEKPCSTSSKGSGKTSSRKRNN